MIRSSNFVALGAEEELMGFLRRPSPKECPAIRRPGEHAQGDWRAVFLDQGLSGSGWDPPKRHRKRRLPRIKGVEIPDELQTRNMPTVVVRQKIERRRVGVPFALEQHAEVGVAKVAEHQARHVAGS